ncbi:AfsR/SARP family transcriptional regulator [Nonomuraea sp. NPDC049655]|uniref:AfsR/SARP family transcriptional regulator n=1 Tax=Nonomuraea sp. NPDC049655 TaxID=3364355 RepID=UPI00379A2D2D
MDFAILGTIRVNGPGGRVHLSRKQRAVLGVLLLHPNATVSRERLISAVWDDPPRSALANIQTYVHQLRRSLAGGGLLVRTEGSGYVCEVPPGSLDLLVFEDTLRLARRERAAGDLAAAERAYAEAVALWRGAPAEDVPLTGAMAPRLLELEERLAVARSEWIDARLALRQDDLVAELRALIAAHPLRERLWEQLVIALHRGGRRDEALDAFREARELLVAELGLEPGPELRRLHAALLAGDPDLDRLPGATAAAEPRFPAAGPAAQWPGAAVPLQALCQLPADTADFVGREPEIAELLQLLRARPDRLSPPIAILSGLPGIGKTTLAVHLAHLLRADYPGGQLFVRLGQDARGARDPGELLDVLLRSLGLDGAMIPASAEERAGLLRQRLADQAVLVVLDDAVDEAQLRHLLPGTPRGAVLVTSRSPLPALEGAVRIRLDLPGERDARLLLERVAGRDRIGAAPDAAEEILRSCGRLPLALRVAGARLAIRPVWPVRELATRLAGHDLDELVVGGLDVRATFEPGYAALPEWARHAFRLLGLAGLDSVAEWTTAALLGLPAREADAVLETLVARGMLTSTEIDAAGQPRYRLHDLLRVYARERAEAEEPTGQRHAALTRLALESLRRTRAAARGLPIPLSPPYERGEPGPGTPAGPTSSTPTGPASGPASSTPTGTVWLSAERRTLVLAVTTAAELGQVATAAELAHHLTGYLTMERFLADAERVQHAVIAAATAAGDERTALRSRLLLVNMDIERGRYPAADAACGELLAAFDRVGDPHGAAYALISRAADRHGSGRLDEALADAYAAIELLAAHDDAAGLAYAWTWPIWIHIERGEHEQAVKIARARLAETGEEDHGTRGNLLRALGTACYQAGETAEAVACYRESLLTAQAVGDRVEMSKVLRRLGEALGALGRFEEAAETLAASLRLFVECGDVLGEALSGHALGVVRLRQGDPREALRHLAAALDRLGRDGPQVWRARTLTEMGRAHARLGRHEEATTAWRHALPLFGDTPEGRQVAAYLKNHPRDKP